MRISLNFQSSVLIALAVHLLFFSVFLFTFPYYSNSPRPTLIFLGSFLRTQDVALFSSQKHGAQAVTDIRDMSLDVRANPRSRYLDKPSLMGKVVSPGKVQFKPSLNVEKTPVKDLGDASDLGLDLKPFPSVKLKMEP